MMNRSKMALARYIILAMAAAAALCVCLMGLAFRMTHTDTFSDPDFWDRAYVGELPEKMAETALEHCGQVLPSCKYILKVEAAGDLESSWRTCTQRVKVDKVFKGDGTSVSEGDEIRICYLTWGIYSSGNDPDPHVSRGFVNVMKTGVQYLVFCDEVIDDNGKLPVFMLFYDGSNFVAPVFSYEPSENKVSKAFYGDSSYVPYFMVKDNEFFCSSEEGMQCLLELKEKMIGMYS